MSEADGFPRLSRPGLYNFLSIQSLSLFSPSLPEKDNAFVHIPQSLVKWEACLIARFAIRNLSPSKEERPFGSPYMSLGFQMLFSVQSVPLAHFMELGCSAYLNSSLLQFDTALGQENKTF